MLSEGQGHPVCTILGGPNGSGKSTLYNKLALAGPFINADVVAKGLNPDQPTAVSISAGKQTLMELARALEARESFAYETTLSSRQSLGLMRSAKGAGFIVDLVFVALRSADLNVLRVAERVARGGHHIPEDVIRRRYETALIRLPDAIRLADSVALFENSTSAGPQLLLQIRATVIEVNSLDSAEPFYRRIAEAVGASLSVPATSILRAPQPD